MTDGDRAGDGVADQAIVEAGADRVEEGRVENLMPKERPVPAHGRPASRLKQRIPSLTVTDLELLSELIDEVLTELADSAR